MANVTKPMALDETLQDTNSALTSQSLKLEGIITKLQGIIAALAGNNPIIGDTDISSIADGTVTGAIDEINSVIENLSISDLSDTNISSPSDGEVLKYDATNQKWINGSGGSSGHAYSTTEQVIGTWIDGKPLYEKTVYLSSLSYDTNWHNVAHNISNLKRVIYFCGIGMNGDGECFLMNSYRPSLTQGIVIAITETNIRYMNNWQDDNSMTAYVTIQYTKTTD